MLFYILGKSVFFKLKKVFASTKDLGTLALIFQHTFRVPLFICWTRDPLSPNLQHALFLSLRIPKQSPAFISFWGFIFSFCQPLRVPFRSSGASTSLAFPYLLLLFFNFFSFFLKGKGHFKSFHYI